MNEAALIYPHQLFEVSPLMNIGLLTPELVLAEALRHARSQAIPLPSLEGFVRQILGWREFIRGAYEADHVRMRSRNFWNHRRPLPGAFWTGRTELRPVDHVIHKVLKTGFAHHIERLMVMGNIMLLSGIDPDRVYEWFMALHVDAYDWVMVPNVYAMSQFADGGLFATKPYISGANYLRKMSDFSAGAAPESGGGVLPQGVSRKLGAHDVGQRFVWGRFLLTFVFQKG